MINKIYSILFYSSDLEKSWEFYEKLSFSAEISAGTLRVEFENVKLAFVDENETEIKEKDGIRGLGIFVYFETENVDEYYKSLTEKGIKTSSEPKDWPWGKREFAVKDPDGYKLIFFSKINHV
jgi:uncharacterized glyoxalase superfamily protein PhnB